VEELIRGNEKFDFNREIVKPLIPRTIESRSEPLHVCAYLNPYKMDLAAPLLLPLLEKFAPHPLAIALLHSALAPPDWSLRKRSHRHRERS
jgi:hypothetical protein